MFPPVFGYLQCTCGAHCSIREGLKTGTYKTQCIICKRWLFWEYRFECVCGEQWSVRRRGDSSEYDFSNCPSCGKRRRGTISLTEPTEAVVSYYKR